MPRELPFIVHKGNEGYCPSCDSRLGRFKQGAGDVPLYLWGGPEVKRVHLGAGQELFYLRSGYILKDGLWQPSEHVRKNYRRTGILSPRHQGEEPMGAVPGAPIECFHCGEKCTVDNPTKT
jgi:hypothetical protein